jgi:hypothetical protein
MLGLLPANPDLEWQRVNTQVRNGPQNQDDRHFV